MAFNNDRTILIQQFTDHLLFFGSTGLVGSLTLKELQRADFYLANPSDIQKKIDSCEYPEIVDFRFDKFIYCINRSIRNLCIAGYEEFNEISGIPSLQYNKQEYFFDRILKSSSGDLPAASEENLISPGIININEDCVEEILNFRIDKQRFQASYVSKTLEKIQLTFNIHVVQIAHIESRKWGSLLPLIFSGCVNMRSKTVNDIVETRLPPLDEIPTMISALGSNSSKGRRTKANRHYVDHELTFQIVKAFNNCERKKLVIITTFNNLLISHLFPYFRAKSRLEYDLQCKLSPRLGQLVLLRPGPMVGEHADMQGNSVKLNHSSNLLRQVLYYKQCCFECKVLLFKECKRTGFKTKASEIIAKSMYRRPGSWILGYCLPASKVAYTTAVKAVEPPIDGDKHLVEVITSQEMDQLVSS